MKDISDNRRDFLKQLLTVGVFSVAAPAVLLGKISPVEIKKKDDKILGLYKVVIADYPALNEIWGSVRIKVPGTFGFFPRIVIARVPKEDYNLDYICVSEQCPHEGFPTHDFDTETYTYACSGHGTLFNVEGTYLWGPASKDLYRFELIYDGGDSMLIEVPALINSNAVESEMPMVFLSKAFPNPCSVRTSFELGLESPSKGSITVFSSNSDLVFDGGVKYFNSGINRIELDVSAYPNGVYFLEVSLNNNKIRNRFVVNR